MQQQDTLDCGFRMNEIQTHSSDWSPDTAQVTLNARIDARLVPRAAPNQGLRLSYGHIVVLDNFIGELERCELLSFLTQWEWDHSSGPPADKWERETADGAGLPKTWGLRQSVLNELATCELPAMKEVHTRLTKLYPEYHIAHMPADLIQLQTAEADSTDTDAHSDASDNHTPSASRHSLDTDAASAQANATNATAGPRSQQDPTPASYQLNAPNSSNHSFPEGQECQAENGQAVDCNQFVGNAAVYGDCYTWHVDADPAAFPPSPWVNAYGSYCNGEPG